MLIDTHSHIYDPVFKDDWAEVIQRIDNAGVKKIFLPNVDIASIPLVNNLAESNPELFYPLMGLHPCSVKDTWATDLENIRKEFEKRKYYAVGEIGIDLYWDKTYYKEQEAAFIRQVEWANELGLPIVIHSRESTREIIDILSAKISAVNGGIFHCFSGTEEEARKIIDMGYYLGIGGVLTFKNSGLGEVIKSIGIERIVLETDAPYLAPVPYRGKRNESSYVKLVAEKLVDVTGLSYTEIAAKTTENALKVFQLTI